MSARRSFTTRIRDSGKLSQPEGECACCAEPATHWLRIAYTYMRGEDETEKACQRHSDMASNPASLDRFFGHMRSKSRFLAERATPSSKTGS